MARHHQSRAQHAASIRNLRKARRALRRHHGGHRRRHNPEMPVVLVNPRRRRRRSKSRKNPTRRRRNPAYGHYMMNPAPRRHHPRRHYRRNPTFGAAAASTGLGFLGGVIAGGLDWGASYAPVGPKAQAAIIGGAGLLLSLGTGYLISPSVAAGIAGGTASTLFMRLRVMVALAGVSAQSTGAGALRPAPRGAGALVRPPRAGAGAVVPAHAAAAVPGLPPAPGMGMPFAGATMRTRVGAGASYNVPNARHYGPDSWIRLRGTAGANYVSAHNTR